MAKKLLFLEDLYEFYINKKEDIRFSSIENDNSPIVVQTHGNLNFEKNTVSDGLMPVVLKRILMDQILMMMLWKMHCRVFVIVRF